MGTAAPRHWPCRDALTPPGTKKSGPPARLGAARSIYKTLGACSSQTPASSRHNDSQGSHCHPADSASSGGSILKGRGEAPTLNSFTFTHRPPNPLPLTRLPLYDSRVQHQQYSSLKGFSACCVLFHRLVTLRNTM